MTKHHQVRDKAKKLQSSYKCFIISKIDLVYLPYTTLCNILVTRHRLQYIGIAINCNFAIGCNRNNGYVLNIASYKPKILRDMYD